VQIKRIEVGGLGVNCYIVFDETKEAAVIDAGDDAEKILAYIEENHLKVKYLINTHAHADHIGANTKIKQKTGARLLIHKADAPWLENPRFNLSAFMGGPIISCKADATIAEGDTVAFGKVKLNVLETPGHTPGGICLLGGGALFSGDTLFQGSVGRCDFPFSSMEDLLSSLHSKLMKLPENTKVYPGHGPSTTIGDELRENPYMQLNF